MKNTYVYIHSGTVQQFNDYQKQNPHYNCVLILDSNTLRARTPGVIIRIGTHYDKWNAQEIEESIATHEQLWQHQLANNTVAVDDDDQKILDYGIE